MVFTLAPGAGKQAVEFPFNLYGVFLAFLAFWQFNRFRFLKLRKRLDKEEITIGQAKHLYLSAINRNNAIGILFFAAEVYMFDLKKLLFGVPEIGPLHTFLNSAGLLIFICHLAATWFWAYQTMGDVLDIGRSTRNYVWGNIKFNLAIVIPWLFFSVLQDSINLDNLPMIVQLLGFIAFLALLAIIAPVFVVRFWDCKPMEDSELKRDIIAYCESQGVRFKAIMSWDALNRSLVTAGVIGLIYPFRYLMITPELMRILDRDELMAVVSHEVGHVKKKHMFYYLAFFISFILVGTGLSVLTEIFFQTSTGFKWLLWMQTQDITFLGFVQAFLFLLLFIGYFRFIFGYYIRNFERQADVYCFQSGIDPAYMVNSFQKLRTHLGDDGKKSNWHHYNISQRIDFIRKSMDDPRHITRHNNRVKRSLLGFAAVILALSVSLFYPLQFTTTTELNFAKYEFNLKQMIRENPDDHRLYMVLGEISFQLKKWEQSRSAYETSLKLNYHQANVLNNLAWFYLKCEDTSLLNTGRALELARAAVRLEQSPYIFDTLAEAYFQNAMYKEAYLAAKQALAIAENNFNYYQKQLAKMQKFYKKFNSVIKI
jgi:Zn-dependent protease with chaperone function